METVRRRGRPTAKETTLETQEQILTKRVYRFGNKIFHDLYKLGVASVLKKIGYNTDPNDPSSWDPVEHVHFYHTVDSSGKTQTTSTSIAAHFHEMRIVKSDNPDEPPQVVCVSGPLKWVKMKKFGKWVREAVPVNEIDDHTHPVIYMRSEEISLRKPNAMAAQVEARSGSPATPDGVLSV